MALLRPTLAMAFERLREGASKVLTFYWILRNKAYVGVLEYNFRQRYGTVEPVTIPGFYPAIIDHSFSIAFRRNFAQAPRIGGTRTPTGQLTY